jgi:hypothetical protein
MENLSPTPDVCDHMDQQHFVHMGDHKFNTLIQQKDFFKLLGLQLKI